MAAIIVSFIVGVVLTVLVLWRVVWWYAEIAWRNEYAYKCEINYLDSQEYEDFIKKELAENGRLIRMHPAGIGREHFTEWFYLDRKPHLFHKCIIRRMEKWLKVQPTEPRERWYVPVFHRRAYE